VMYLVLLCGKRKTLTTKLHKGFRQLTDTKNPKGNKNNTERKYL
jgi:hypothetical protein